MSSAFVTNPLDTQLSESPLVRTIPAKGCSSSQLFRKINSEGDALLMDGTEGGWFDGGFSLLAGSPFGIFRIRGNQSQFDYLSKNGKQSFPCNSDPILNLQKWLDRFRVKTQPANQPHQMPFLQGGLAGFFSYELLHHFEKIPPAPALHKRIDDAHLLFLNLFVLHDHRRDLLHITYTPHPEIRMGRDLKDVRHEGWQKIKQLEAKFSELPEEVERPLIVSDCTPGSAPAPAKSGTTIPLEVTSHCSRARYIEMVSQAKSYIASGEIFQANLSHCFTTHFPERSLFKLYQKLSMINPSPFSAYLDFEKIQIASVSPERLVRIKKEKWGDVVETRPIAGTRPRGTDSLGDQALVNALYQSDKERAEHLMLVDLARNDLGKISRYGTVKMDSMMHLEQYSHVSHLVSNITGSLIPNTSPLQVLKALFPGGTITGVPKIRCMAIISELEKQTRGIYTGAIGYIGFNGEMDLNIAIRTAVLENEQLSYQVGAGIVADSDPALEYQETLHKAAAFFKAVQAR